MRLSLTLAISTAILSVVTASQAFARMNDGDYQSFRIIGRDGVPVTVSINPTDWHHVFPLLPGPTRVDDPGWTIEKPGVGTIHANKISVVATDGTVRNLGITCTVGEFYSNGDAKSIYCNFRISKADSDDDERDDGRFWFRDPEGSPAGELYCVSILPVTTFPGAPRVRIKHAPCP
jgi:hypothetical protein